MPRSIPTFLSAYDIRRICNAAKPATYADSALISELRPQPDRTLAGQELTFTLADGETMTYRFDRDRIAWSNGGAFHEEYAEYYQAPRAGIYFVHHLKTASIPYGAATAVIDTVTRSVTYIDMALGTMESNRDVQRVVRFGAIAGGECTHSLTNDLSGKVIDWKFAEDAFIHQMYENWSCCEFVGPPPAHAYEWKAYFSTFNPTKYVKLQDNLYLISFCAPGSSGTVATMLMDLDTMRSVGSFFGIDMQDMLRSYTFGARGAFAPVGFRGRYAVQ